MKLRSILAFLVPVSVLGSPDPQIYLEYNWYEIEIVVFEPTDGFYSSERLVHVGRRTYPNDVVVSTRTVEQYTEHFDPTDSVALGTSNEGYFLIGGSTNQRPESQQGTELQIDKSESLRSTRSNGCMLHTRITPWYGLNSTELSKENEDISAVEETEPDGVSQNVVGEIWAIDEPQTYKRDSRLPEWLPDHWQTYQRNLLDTGAELGLCEEDIGILLAFDDPDGDFQQLMQSEFEASYSRGDEVEQVSERITAAEIEARFKKYEEDLHLTSTTKRFDNLSLTREVSRMKNRGYRVIEHVSWHQRAGARGYEPNTLVQFGNKLSSGFYEIEGLLQLGLSRFLHLRVDLWKETTKPSILNEANEEKGTNFFYLLDQRRRLSLDEIHYFDHPAFGLLVRIRRLPIPGEFISLLESLDSAS